MTDIFTENKYKNFYLNLHRLPLDDPLYPIYEAIAYMLEDIEDVEPQFNDIFKELGNLETRIEDLAGQVR
jgi:hypothetical protein